jgi:hypothetical protein
VVAVRREIPHQEVVGRAIAAGRLGQLLLANTVTNPTLSFSEPTLPRSLSIVELQVAVDIANGLDVEDIAKGEQHKAKRKAAITLKELFGIPEIVQSNVPARWLLMRCLYTGSYAATGQKVIETDEPLPASAPTMPAALFVPFGLLTYGLDYEGAAESLGLRRRAVGDGVRQSIDWLGRVYPHGYKDKTDTIRGIHAAFETGVLGPGPDKMLPADFLISSMLNLLQKDSLTEPI